MAKGATRWDFFRDVWKTTTGKIVIISAIILSAGYFLWIKPKISSESNTNVFKPTNTVTVQNKVELPKPAQPEHQERTVKAPRSKSADTNTKTIINAKNVNTGTNYGQIGDNNTQNIHNPEFRLTEEFKLQLVTAIEQKKAALNIQSDSINVEVYIQSNAVALAQDIVNFLPTKGYKIAARGTRYNAFNGILVDKGLAGYITVYIGILAYPQ